MMKRALYQAGDIARQYDPQLAHLYYREMVHHGKTHLQAVGAVMSHLGARILTVLRENRPYELRDAHGKPISKEEARKLILSEYKVPDEISRQRRRRNSRKPVSSKVKATNSEGRSGNPRTSEAATAPQSEGAPPFPKMPVYVVGAEKSRQLGA
jgi:hypothetical protein